MNLVQDVRKDTTCNAQLKNVHAKIQSTISKQLRMFNLIKRNALPENQSKMYVYVQDEVDKWKIEILAKKNKEAQNGN